MTLMKRTTPCGYNMSAFRLVRSAYNGEMDSWDSNDLDVGRGDWVCKCGWRFDEHITWPHKKYPGQKS